MRVLGVKCIVCCVAFISYGWSLLFTLVVFNVFFNHYLFDPWPNYLELIGPLLMKNVAKLIK